MKYTSSPILRLIIGSSLGFFIGFGAHAVTSSKPVNQKQATTLTYTNAYTTTRVKDGDSLLVGLEDNFEVEIRLLEIDAPELNQKFGREAKAALERLCLNKTTRIIGRDKDKYGRVLGQVYCDDINVNSYLVENGYAWVFRYFSDNPKLIALENKAKSECLGLWQNTNPLSPWDFRAKKKTTDKPKNPNVDINVRANCALNVVAQ